MSASAEDLNDIRLMVAEPTATTYSDATLARYIEKYALTDSDGYEPDDTDWTPTYDLNRAASVVWYQKAMTHVGDYKFTADGSTFERNEVYNQCMRAASRFASMASPDSLEVHVDHDYEKDYQSTYWSAPSEGSLPNYVINAIQSDEED
jgi:hypothetical protein